MTVRKVHLVQWCVHNNADGGVLHTIRLIFCKEALKKETGSNRISTKTLLVSVNELNGLILV